jgi:hypothetical protein
MRALFLCAAAFFAASCADVQDDGAGLAGGEGGYTLEIRASPSEQTYLVYAPDGAIVGGRAADGASALLDSEGVRALASEPAAADGETPEVMSLRLPGFSMSVSGAHEDAGGNGRVALSIGGDDGRNIVVDASEGGPGEGDDRAFVRITGADEAAVRRFIVEADELSPSVQARMLAALGMGE